MIHSAFILAEHKERHWNFLLKESDSRATPHRRIERRPTVTASHSGPNRSQALERSAVTFHIGVSQNFF